MITHLDLFSGIGGFALAVDAVWDDAAHIFCEIDPYCQALLKKRFERSVIYGDIRELTADTRSNKLLRVSKNGREEIPQIGKSNIFILTGGFPCQPFSCAGKRRGTEDNRYLWPEMLRVIKDFKPEWVIAENVRGILTIESGVVFEQVCVDLENAGYETQPFIIPACSVNAPHRRDRVWIVAHRTGERPDNGKRDGKERQFLSDKNRDAKKSESERNGWRCGVGEAGADAQNPIGERSGWGLESSRQILGSESPETENARPSWEDNWFEVATELCGMDDGLSAKLDGLELSKSRHRVERLKALGNSIVPQVAIEIMKAIKGVCGGEE